MKKNAQCESCELSFIWGKMRTVAQETASQIALSEGGKVSTYVILMKGGCNHAHLTEGCY